MSMKMDIYGFQGNQNSPYLKISVGEPRNINRLRNLVRERNANWKGLWSHYSAEDKIDTYDNIQYVLRFMIDTKVGSRLLFLEHS
jgi:DNA polymerase delta subunit 1